MTTVTYEETWRATKSQVIEAAGRGESWAIAEEKRRQRVHDERYAAEEDHDAGGCWCCCLTCLDDETEETQ